MHPSNYISVSPSNGKLYCICFLLNWHRYPGSPKKEICFRILYIWLCNSEATGCNVVSVIWDFIPFFLILHFFGWMKFIWNLVCIAKSFCEREFLCIALLVSVYIICMPLSGEEHKKPWNAYLFVQQDVKENDDHRNRVPSFTWVMQFYYFSLKPVLPFFSFSPKANK